MIQFALNGLRNSDARGSAVTRRSWAINVSKPLKYGRDPSLTMSRRSYETWSTIRRIANPDRLRGRVPRRMARHMTRKTILAFALFYCGFIAGIWVALHP